MKQKYHKKLEKIVDLIRPLENKKGGNFHSKKGLKYSLLECKPVFTASDYVQTISGIYDSIGLKEEAKRGYNVTIDLFKDKMKNYSKNNGDINEHTKDLILYVEEALLEPLPDYLEDLTKEKKLSILKKNNLDLLTKLAQTAGYIYQSRFGSNEWNNMVTMRNIKNGYLDNKYNINQSLINEADELLKDSNDHSIDGLSLSERKIKLETSLLKTFLNYARKKLK